MITADDLDNLRHMLGVSDKSPRGYRNYFVAGADNVPSMERLREAVLGSGWLVVCALGRACP